MSAWGWFEKAADAVKKGAADAQEKLKHLDMEKIIDKAKAMEDKKAVDAGAEAPLPWEDVPPKWAGRVQEWEALVKGMIKDDATFLIGPERGLTKREQQDLRLHCISVDFATETADYYMDKLNPEILSHEPLEDVRFRLVPKFINEDGFWVNFFWKVREVGKTSNANVEARALLVILNSRRGDMPEGPGLKRALPDSVPEKTQKIEAILGEAMEKGVERVENEREDRRQQAVVDIHEEGQEALALLKECMNDDGMEEHLQVAYDTCVSCREKLQAEIETDAADDGTTAFSRLLDLAGRLDDAIEGYNKRLAGEATPPAAATVELRASPVLVEKEAAGEPQGPPRAEVEEKPKPAAHVDVADPAATAAAAAAAAAAAPRAASPADSKPVSKHSESNDSLVKITDKDLGVSTCSDSGEAKSTKSSSDAAPKVASPVASAPTPSSVKKTEFTALPWDDSDDD
eukprot:TRINITY_DN1740_c0_g1_i1.p1 TRINITY_DN1740_c0_g1~~TRINITY_DN1740_c0_g1_i1.p1  ORF type:complete len:459 (+),score=206.05 TRINITY_DN1740_c0_g1_i1:81-1457(+)